MDNRITPFIDEFLSDLESGHPPRRPSEVLPEFDIDTAYRIQAAQLTPREDRGDPVRAIKLGLTQSVQQEQFGIPHVTFGSLTASSLLEPGQPLTVAPGRLIKVEAEIVVVIGEDMTSVPAHADDLRSLPLTVHAGIEILESRYRDPVFHPLDAVADNQSAFSGVWLNEGVPLADADMAAESVELFLTAGEPHPGVGSRILGDPLEAVFQAIEQRLTRGFPIFRGLAIFTGNLCEQALAVVPGNRVSVDFSTLGTLTLDVVAFD